MGAARALTRSRPSPARPSKCCHVNRRGQYPLQEPPCCPLELPGRRRDLRKTKDAAQDSLTPGAMISSTPQCTSYSGHLLCAPDSGRDDDFFLPPYMYPAPLCVYKRRRRASHTFRRPHTTNSLSFIRSLSRYWHLLQSSSRDLGASLPLSPRLYPLLQAPPVQDSTVHSHTPLLDVRPHGRNQDKPVRPCITSCINHPE